MGLETGDTIGDLNPSWPLGSDPKSQGDDHLRLLKVVFQNDALSLLDGGIIEGPVTVLDAFEAESGVFITSLQSTVFQVGYLITMAMDTVISVPTPLYNGFANINVRAEHAVPPEGSGTVLFDVGNSIRIIKIGGYSKFLVTDDPLDGISTNPDAVTVGALEGGQDLRIQNRIGDGWTFRVTFTG